MNRGVLSSAAASRIVLLAGFVLAGFANTVAATNYYVSTAGKDSNSGTSVNAPFLTPQRCADVAVAGDTCYFRGGMFHSASTILAIATSGTTGNPITFKNYASETAVFSVETSAIGVYGIYVHDSSWIVIDGLRIVGGDYGIVLDGGVSNSQILNTDVSRGYRGGVHIGTDCTYNLIQGNRIYDNNQINWPRGEAYAKGADWGSAVSIGGGSDNNLFQRNYVYWNHGEGVVFGSAKGNIARGNVVADNWDDNIRIIGRDSVVDANFVYLSEAAKTWPVTQGDSHSNAAGIALSVEASDGLTLGTVQVTNNIIVNALTCIHALPDRSGGAFRKWSLSNNTCALNDSGIEIKNSGPISDLIVQNNIVIANEGSRGPMMQISPGAARSTFRNNIYYGSAADQFYWGDQPARDFANWVSLSGETRSLSTDPLLVDARTLPARLWDDPEGLGPGSPTTELSIRQYAPTASSPAADAGVDSLELRTVGYRGSHRDIGALEYCDPDDGRNDDPNLAVPVCPSNFLPIESSRDATAGVSRSPSR